MHARLPVGLGGVAGAACAVVGGPGVEAGQVDEVLAQALHGLRRRAVAEFAEEAGVVHGAVLHQLQQPPHQSFVVLLGAREA
ncbi:hypothetical protein D3C77_523920 [compost metagenome]